LSSPRRIQSELFGHFPRIDDPGQVGNFASSRAHRAGNAQARAVNGNAFGLDEVSKNTGQPVVLLARVVFSTTHCSRLPSVSKAASRVRVAPISPARIIVQ
jgi:hypothetical protein